MNETKQKKDRSPNFSEEEKDILVEIVLGKYRHIIESKKTDALTSVQKQNSWKNVALDYNSAIINRPNRSWQSLKLCYENIKKRTKKAYAQDKIELHKTGGGDYKKPTVDETGQKLIATLQAQFLPLANPFDDDANFHTEVMSGDYPNSGDDSDEDIITDYLMSGEQSRPSMACKHEGPGPLVPTISVTPHSPGAKQYPILEDNLQHLHEIHESIQQMRDQTAVQLLNSQILGLTQYVRLSASCPSLNNDGWDPELLALVNSSPNHNPSDIHFMPPGFVDISVDKGNSKDWHLQYSNSDITRRRSWTALEDLSKCREKRNSERQRSMSLSSLDSEQDDPYFYPMDDGGSTGLLVTDKTCHTVRGSGGASTHSLNEADLQNDFKKIVAKREADSLRLLPARLPLQKSVSTPSIIAVRDSGSEVAVDGTIPIIPPGTESETEEELLSAESPKIQISLDEFLKDVAYGRDPVKRRKRGSIFFRRKKDKPKKVSHQWVSACYGSAHACDWCAKPLTNKPALYCENCTTTVHQNSCKDHIMDCNKPKLAKNTSKAVILPAPKQTSVRRGSGLQQGHTQNSSNRVINEEKEGDGSHHDGSNVSADEVLQDRYEFLGEDPITANDLETDPFLGLHQEEPDSWSPTVGKEVTKKLKDKEIKRQEHMYEFILTEKHHCLTLRVMQKVFVEGLQRHFQLGKDLERMFPRLFDLTEIHLNFLQRLRERQRTAPIVETISDILLEQFSGLGAQKIKSAYGEFCSRHRDAVDIYKSYLHDHRFSEFMRHCQCNPLLKKKGIPECILFVTQRLTKYPLLIEPLIKTSKDNKREQERLGKALLLVKEILTEVDAQVAEKEKEDRKLEIYNRIEAKSFTVHRGHKFKKSDILSKNRRLRFEGVAMLMQGRGKMQLVLVIVLSDVLFFLLENNHKYTFFTPDNKAGVVSLQKLLVREKAGQESRGIYLISSNPADPEMFELKVHKPKDKQAWIHAIRSAVQGCQEDEDEVTELSSEERQRLLQVKQSQIRQIVGVLRQKDMEQAQILEEKMALQQKLLAAAGVEHLLESPNYTSLVAEDTDSSVMWQEVLSTVQEVNSLASSLYAPGTNLSRSVSSVGEHQSEAYISPTLPKRAETFGGFDNANKEQLAAKGLVMKHWDQTGTPESESNPGSKTDVRSHELPIGHLPWRGGVMTTVPPGELPALLMLGQEQQLAAVQLSHYVYKLLSIISQQMTSIHSLQAQLSAYKSQRTHDDGKERRPVYRHNQQLEELRNLQDKLTHEKEAWQRERDTEEKYIEEKKAELQRLQEIIRAEQNDIIQQREQLYRKLEMLTSQGILISPNLPMILTHEESGGETSPGTGGDSTVSPTPTMDLRRKADLKWKSGPSKSSLPLNLISATNQQKVASTMQIKQQLPLKLATKLGTTAPAGSMQQMLPLKLSQGSEGRRSSGTNSGAGYQRLGSGSFSPPGNKRRGETLTSSHTRTGSSPAMMQNSSNSPSTGETPGVKSPESQPCTPCGPAPQASEEEVIFF